MLILFLVLAIYATLGLAGSLAEMLREHELLVSTMVLCFLFTILATIIGSGLNWRLRGKEIWVLFGIITVYGLMFVRMGGSIEERTHLFEYGIVAIIMHHAFIERIKQGGKVPAPAILAIVLTSLLGWLDEGIQAVLPNRVYDIFDVFVNFLSAFMAISAKLALTWTQKRITNARS